LADPLRAALPERCVLDGEVVIARDGALDFEALLLRIHPAASRVKMLAEESPASFVAWDLLALDDEDLRATPQGERRARLESVLGDIDPPIHLTPATRDRATAQDWFERFEGAGLDGVVAKRLDVPYLPGSRDGVAKVKPYKTADCVIVGFRWSDKADGRISTLLLGLYDDAGELDFVGHCSGFPAPVRRELEEKLPKMVAKGKLSDKRIPGGQSRWSAGRELDWNPVRPKLVIEVRYDKLEKNRFRHGTRFLRFRPDKDPDACTWREVRPPRRASDLTVPKLLAAP